MGIDRRVVLLLGGLLSACSPKPEQLAGGMTEQRALSVVAALLEAKVTGVHKQVAADGKGWCVLVPPSERELAVRVYDRLGLTEEESPALADIRVDMGMPQAELVRAQMVSALAGDLQRHLRSSHERLLHVSVQLAGTSSAAGSRLQRPELQVGSASVLLRYRRSDGAERGCHDGRVVRWPESAAVPEIDGEPLLDGGDPDWPMRPATLIEALAQGAEGLRRDAIVMTFEPVPDLLAGLGVQADGEAIVKAPEPPLAPRGRLGLVVFAGLTTLTSLLFLRLWRRDRARMVSLEPAHAELLEQPR